MHAVQRTVLRFALNQLDTLAEVASIVEAACTAAAEKICDHLDLIPTGVRERATLAKETS